MSYTKQYIFSNYFPTNISTADLYCVSNSTDHKSTHQLHLKNPAVASVTIFSYDIAMILSISSMSRFQYQNCDIVSLCVTVFTNFLSLFVRTEVKIVKNLIKCQNFIQNWYEKGNNLFLKNCDICDWFCHNCDWSRLRQLWLQLQQLWCFAIILVGVVAIVVDCDICEHCDNFAHFKALCSWKDSGGGLSVNIDNNWSSNNQVIHSHDDSNCEQGVSYWP